MGVSPWDKYSISHWEQVVNQNTLDLPGPGHSLLNSVVRGQDFSSLKVNPSLLAIQVHLYQRAVLMPLGLIGLLQQVLVPGLTRKVTATVATGPAVLGYLLQEGLGYNHRARLRSCTPFGFLNHMNFILSYIVQYHLH